MRMVLVKMFRLHDLSRSIAENVNWIRDTEGLTLLEKFGTGLLVPRDVATDMET